MITRKANWKRRIGLFLAIIMLFEGSGLQSVVALAAETSFQKTEQTVEETQSVQIETTEPEEAAENLTISASCSLQEDKVVRNLIIKGGTLQLNGHQLKVLGNVTQSGGTVTLKGGMLYCKGDYIFTGYSRLIMDKQNDYLKVQGDFVCQSNYEMNTVTAGVLEFAGDFTQANGSGDREKRNFVTSGTSEVILSGETKQNINFAGSASYFSRVTLKNSSEEGIVSDGLINSLEMNRNGVMITTGIDGKYGWKLSEDETFEGDIVLIGGTLDLNGHTLTVTGNLIQENGTVKLNGGTLEVKKDYRLQRCDRQSDKNVYSASPAKLHSIKDTGVLSVKRHFIIESEISHKEFFTKGEIRVSGNVSQLQTSVQDNFVMSGESRIVFNGTEKQSLSLASWGSGSSRLQNFEVTNEKGVELVSDIYVTGEVCDYKNPVTGKSVVPCDTTTFVDKYFSGNIIWNEWTDISSLNEIGGDFVCQSGSSLKNNLTVQGNVTVEGNLKLKGKELNVGENVF